MRDSFVLTFLIIFMLFLGFISVQVIGVRKEIKQVQRDVSAAPMQLDFHDTKVIKQIAAGKFLVPPPPPCLVSPGTTGGAE